MNINGNLSALSRHEKQMEPHDFDKLKQEEADEQLQFEENMLFKSIEPYINGINSAIRVHSAYYGMSKEECANYVRDTLANLIQG